MQVSWANIPSPGACTARAFSWFLLLCSWSHSALDLSQWLATWTQNEMQMEVQLKEEEWPWNQLTGWASGSKEGRRRRGGQSVGLQCRWMEDPLDVCLIYLTPIPNKNELSVGCIKYYQISNWLSRSLGIYCRLVSAANWVYLHLPPPPPLPLLQLGA